MVMEVYQGETTYIKFLPYAFIKSIDLKEESEEVMVATRRHIGFTIPKEVTGNEKEP